MEKTITLNTGYGTLVGTETEHSYLFKGIRYATAERFRKPQIVHHVEGEYNARKFGYTCPQLGQKEGGFYWREFWHHTEYSTEHNEDCLFLNIWIPKTGTNHPVAVWIHGGAYMSGFSSKVEIDGEYWNLDDVVLVSINYRVGPLGFLTHPMLDEAYGDSGNYGIYDQLCALDWVHEHIADFGGNPDHITVMGQSAGAMSVQTLIGSPLLNVGVTGAVMQSGGGIENFMNETITKEDLAEYHDRFLKANGIDTLEKLLSMDAGELAQAAAMYGFQPGGKKGLLFFPHLNEDILPESYEDLVRTGKVRNIPCLIGCTKNDMTVGEEGLEASPIYTGCVKMAEALAGLGHEPAYVFVFAKDPLGGEGQGCFHSSDLWYSFRTLDRSWREKDADDYRVAEEMMHRWTSFIRTGNPNNETYSGWEPATAEKPNTYTFR